MQSFTRSMFTRMIGVVYLIFEGLVFVSFFHINSCSMFLLSDFWHSWEWEIVGDMYCMFLRVRDCWRHVLHAGKSADGWMVLFFAHDSRWRPGNQQNCKIVLVTYNDMIVNFIYYIQYHKIVIINTLTSVNFQIFHYTRIWDYVDPMIIVNML